MAETEAAALGRTAAETSPPPGRSATSRIAPPDGGNGTDQGVDPLVDLRLYLDTVYGHAGEAPDEPIGYVHVGSGTQARFTETGSYRHRYFTEYAFEWPRQRHALETRIRGELAAHADVYVTPYLLKRGKGHRNKGTTVERLHVHTDVDGDVDMDRVRALGALAVDSGSPGHAQVYVRLSAPVDVRTHEQLCRLLCRHLGGDKGKVSDNDYLRPPGTVNRKAAVRGQLDKVPPTPVRWLIRPNGSETRWDPAELKTHLQNTTGPQESRDRPQRAKPADLDKGAIKDLPVRVQAALGKSQLKDGSTDVDRSETVYAVVAACFDTGLTVEQAEQVVRTRTDLADRLDENPKDLDRIWSKLESKRDEEGRAPRGSVPPSAELPPPMTETPATGKAPSLPPTVDVTGLWGRPVMRQIQVWAQAKMVSPLAALGATLPRALAMLHPEYVLPDVVIGYGSLNFYTGLVGRSGGGKGGPNTIAERAIRFVSGKQDLPLEALDEWRDSRSNDELYTAELGSGEGFGHAYVRMDKKTKELHQVRTSVLYNCPEIDWLRGVGGRQGSTITPVLRKAWSGEALNPQFAAADKRVRLGAHTYRVGLVIGVQPKRADVLLDDADGGLPQRFLWVPVNDPDAPAERPTAPEPMSVRIPLPPAKRYAIPLCNQAITEIETAGLRRLVGEGDDLDTHALFCREKVAAGLALLDSHLVDEGITSEDWELAGLMMKVSDATRGWVQDVRREQEAVANRARGRAEGERELVKRNVTAQQELERTVGTIRRRLAREADWLAYGKVRAAVHSDLRKWVDDALETLITAGDVQAENHSYNGQETTRYRSRS